MGGDAVKLRCADCPKEFDSKFRAKLHVIASVFTWHKVVTERRCDHAWNGEFVEKEGNVFRSCSKCHLTGPIVSIVGAAL